jgi:hypothetical protein
LPILIGAPPDSPLDPVREVYYRKENGSPPRETTMTGPSAGNPRRATRSTVTAASSAFSKASTKASIPAQPQKRPEIHLFTSSSRIADTKGDEDEEIIELSPSERPVKSRNKRPLSDDDDYDDEDTNESRIKRPSLRSLYGSDEEVKEVPKKVKGSKKNGEASGGVKEATKVAKKGSKRASAGLEEASKKGSKRAGEAAAGSRGGRATGRGGKAAGRGGSKMKSKAVISDTSESEVEVPAATPSAAARPKPRPAYQGANPTLTATPDKAPSSTANVTPSAPVPIPIQFTTTNVATTGSSLTPALEASVEAHQFGHRESNGRNPGTVAQQEPPAAIDAAGMYAAKPDLPYAPTLTPTVMPPSAVQSDLFDSLLPSGDNNARSYAHDGRDSRLDYPGWDSRPDRPHWDPRSDRSHTPWDSRPEHPSSLVHRGHMQGFGVGNGLRDSRQDFQSRDASRSYSRGLGGPHQGPYADAGWEIGPGGPRYVNFRDPEVRRTGRDVISREDYPNYNPNYNGAYNMDPMHHNFSMRSLDYASNTMLDDDRHYLPPPPPPTRASPSPYALTPQHGQLDLPSVPSAPYNAT